MRRFLPIFVLLGTALVLQGTGSVEAAPVTNTSVSNIRRVDFKNFTYDTVLGPRKAIDGFIEEEDGDNVTRFSVLDVDHGDVTGDGREDAIVTVVENTGGTGQFTNGLLFTISGGRVVKIGETDGGDRADGGIRAITIQKSGVVTVEQFGQDNSGACCPEYITSSPLRFRGGKFVGAGSSSRRAYIRICDGCDTTEIKFLRGTSSARIEGDDEGVEVSFGAGAGQRASLTVDSARTRSTVTLLDPNGRSLVSVRAGRTGSARLPVAGNYILRVERTLTGTAPVDVGIELSIK